MEIGFNNNWLRYISPYNVNSPSMNYTLHQGHS